MRKKRAIELGHLKMYRYLLNIILQLGRSAPPVGTMVTVIVYALATGEVRGGSPRGAQIATARRRHQSALTPWRRACRRCAPTS